MSASVRAVCVDPLEVHRAWPLAAIWIKIAMERGDLGTFAALQCDVLNGHALLWLAWDDPNICGAAVTQIVQCEKSKVCMVQACGGEDCAEWLHLLGDIEIYARNERCDCVRLMGRRGWEKLLTDYRTTKVVLERRL